MSHFCVKTAILPHYLTQLCDNLKLVLLINVFQVLNMLLSLFSTKRMLKE